MIGIPVYRQVAPRFEPSVTYRRPSRHSSRLNTRRLLLMVLLATALFAPAAIVTVHADTNCIGINCPPAWDLGFGGGGCTIPGRSACRM